MRKVGKLSIVSIYLSIFLSILFFTTAALGSEKGSDLDNISENCFNEVDSVIENYMKKGSIPGLYIGIIKEGKTVYEKGFGYADLEERKEVNNNTLFEIGSNSKAFTALAILNLEKNGQLDINDKVSDFLPWFKTRYKGEETVIHLKDLLNHTSGIPFKTIDLIPECSDNNALEKTVNTLVGIELNNKPGEKFEYATINYDVLGLIIEEITGQSYEDYIENNILSVMKLENTFLERNSYVDEEIAKGYRFDFGKIEEYDAPVYKGNIPAGYIISSGKDMLRWLNIQMDNISDSSFDKSIIKNSQKNNYYDSLVKDGVYYNNGWFKKEDSKLIYHGGNNPNYSSYIIFNPEEKTGVLVLSNINSDYVKEIACNVQSIMVEQTYSKSVTDLNKTIDTGVIIFVAVCVLEIILMLFLIIKAIKEILDKKRILKLDGIRGVFRFVISLSILFMIFYSINEAPGFIYRGVSWHFISVWLPGSIKIARYIFTSAILITYLYYLLKIFYKKETKCNYIFLFLLSVVSGLGNALIIYVINTAVSSSNEVKMKLLVFFILGVVLYVYGQKIVRWKLIELTNGLVYKKRRDMVNSLLKFQYGKFEMIEKGRIESTLNNDTENINRFANTLVNGLTSTVTLIFCIIYLGFINLKALMLALAILLVITSIYYVTGIYANKLQIKARDLQNSFFMFINDLIEGFKELALNNKKKIEFQQAFDDKCIEYREKREKSALAFANMNVIGELLFTVALGFVAIIFPLFLKGLDTENISSYVFVLLYITGPVHSILNMIPNILEVKISIKRINELLEEVSCKEDDERPIIERENTEKISLKMENVEYVYGSQESTFKVGPINYEFNSGEIIFITGGNGSGKSTLAKLLTGLYKPSNGVITINDFEVTSRELSEKYSTVFADFHLFDRLYGIDWINREKDIEKYLRVLNLQEKVEIKNGIFSTTKLSTGQKKRLALLVAYLEDKPIYLFDEWAADQDPEFRKYFYENILQQLKREGKCVIAVTHDDHYFHFADKLIKMNLGNLE